MQHGETCAELEQRESAGRSSGGSSVQEHWVSHSRVLKRAAPHDIFFKAVCQAVPFLGLCHRPHRMAVKSFPLKSFLKENTGFSRKGMLCFRNHNRKQNRR